MHKIYTIRIRVITISILRWKKFKARFRFPCLDDFTFFLFSNDFSVLDSWSLEFIKTQNDYTIYANEEGWKNIYNIMSLYLKIKDECTWFKSSDNHANNNARVAESKCVIKAWEEKKTRLESAWSFSLTHKILFNVNERNEEKKRKMTSEFFV